MRKNSSVMFVIIYRVTLFEDPVYRALIEKIMSNRTSLLKRLEKADKAKTGNYRLVFFLIHHIL